MASPFAIFRRNQQTLLVVLFILAIFAFTLSDLLTSQKANLPMLGLIVGTCIMTAIGAFVKKPAKYAGIGACGGLLIGYATSLFVTPDAPDTVAETSFGSISEIDVQQFLSERAKANEFISFAIQQAVGQQEARQLVFAYSFGMNGIDPREEAVISFLLLEEAKRLGIYIDKETVTAYINRATQNKLSKTAYLDVIKSIGITDGQLYQILQNQIAIRTARIQLMPTGFMTPQQYWDMYKKLNFKQRIQTVAIPVDELAETVTLPDESELRAFFEEHKNKYPSEPRSGDVTLEDRGLLAVENLSEKSASRLGLDSTEGVLVTEVRSNSIADLRGIKPNDVIVKVDDEKVSNKSDLEIALKNLDPASGIELTVRNARGSRNVHLKDLVGFRQPRKVQLAYLEANYLDLESTVEEISDQDIEDFYEQNKDPLYLNRRIPDDPLGGDSLGQDPGSGTGSPDLGNPNQNVPLLDFNSPSPGTEAPPKEENPGSTEPENSEDKEQTPDRSKLPEVPDPGEKSESSEPGSQSRLDRAGSALQPVAFVQEESESQTPESSADAEQPDTNAADAAEKQPEGETSEESTEKKTGSEEDTSDSKAIPPAPETDLEAPLRAPRPEPPKYRDLDDLLREEIRDTLLRQKTRELQQKLASRVLDRMTELSDLYYRLQDQDSIGEFAESESVQEFAKQKIKELKAQSEPGTAKLNKLEDLRDHEGKNLTVSDAKNLFVMYAQEDLQELAAANGLSYRQTPLMSASDLSLAEDYSIGSAKVGMELSTTSQETVTQYVFTLPPESVYEANAARSINPDSIYVFWKTADKEAHVPTWEEEGIPDAVREAWRIEQARPLAEKRAGEIKEKLEATDETWSQYLIENPETVKGEKGGVPLQPLISDPFSWMTTQRSSVPTMFGFSLPAEVPVLTDLSTVENEGPEFMETVFEKMDEDDIEVVPNHDLSVYYVVQVRDRRPNTPEERQLKRDQFLSEEIFPTSFLPTPYMEFVDDGRGELARAWLDDLKRKYEVKMFEREEQNRS